MGLPRFARAGLAGVAVLALGVAAIRAVDSDDYHVRFLMPSFDSAYEGAAVTIDGVTVGSITAVEVKDGQALVSASIDEDNAPLHAGTTAGIAWRNAVGSRTLVIEPGDKSNPELPEGKVIEATRERVELDDVLATLDGPTRANVQNLVKQLDTTLNASAEDLNETLSAGGPALTALAEVLESVGSDGPAIRRLVTDLHLVTEELSTRDTELAATVNQLSHLVAAAANQQGQIRDALDGLPGTLNTATRVLGMVPATVDEAAPLLEDLQPTTARLPAVARRLSPVLTELRPAVDELRPTLVSASELLRITPELLDSGTSVVPQLDQALTQLQPAVSFLRPYTPEVIGFLTNWTSLFSAKNSAGHFGRALVPASSTSFNSNPTGIVPPGIIRWLEPEPGANADVINRGIVDANGDGVR